MPAAAPRSGAHPRPAARSRLAVWRHADPQHRRHVRPLPASQARACRRPHLDGAWHRLPDGRGVSDGAALHQPGDARLLARVRWRLVAWSAGSTLVLLLILGTALYLSVDASL